MTKRRIYNPEFKAKVAIDAIKNVKGTAEICSEYKVPATNLYEWRDKALNNLHQVFIPESEYIKRQKIVESEVEKLQRLIGEIIVENSCLKKS